MRRALLTVGVLVVAREAGAQALTLEYMGPGGTYADINDQGQVVMRSWDGNGDRVGRYTDGVGLEMLDGGGNSIFGTRISNTGQVCWQTEGATSFRYTDGVGAEHLAPAGSTAFWALSINGSGQVLGSGNDELQAPAAWIFDANGATSHIVPEFSGAGGYMAAAFNDAGQIVGVREPPLVRAHAVRYTPGVGMLELGTLGGTESVAQGINSQGAVFGWSQAGDGLEYDYLYTDSGGMETLGRLAIQMILNDMNTAGWIAARDTLTNHADVWTRETGFVDLNTLLPAGLKAELFEAFGINDHNQLAVSGVVDGQYGIYRVTVNQLPSPGCAMPLVGLWALSRRRRRSYG